MVLMPTATITEVMGRLGYSTADPVGEKQSPNQR
jgi:hypothetical protein